MEGSFNAYRRNLQPSQCHLGRLLVGRHFQTHGDDGADRIVVQELTQNGVMEPDRLFQSPFTDMNAQGPMGVFPPAKVTQIVNVLNTINAHAVA